MEGFIPKVWRRWMAEHWWRAMEIWHVTWRWRETRGKWGRRVTIVRRMLFAVAWWEAWWVLIWRWWVCLQSGRLILKRIMKRHGFRAYSQKVWPLLTKWTSYIREREKYKRRARLGEHATRREHQKLETVVISVLHACRGYRLVELLRFTRA